MPIFRHTDSSERFSVGKRRSAISEHSNLLSQSAKLEGITLFQALSATIGQVKLLSDNSTRKISPIEALKLARSGTYCGFGSSNRVRHMREIDTRTPAIADPSFWDGRGVLHFWADQRS